MHQQDRQKLIDRRVAGGGNREESEKLLEDLLARHEGENLACALLYNGFGVIS
jgi:hypothetical protein